MNRHQRIPEGEHVGTTGRTLLHVTTAIALVVLLGLLVDPFMLWMPDMAAMTVLIIVAALLCVWIGLVIREHGGDERSVAHRMHAGRIAYLLGIGVLTAGLVVQGFTYNIDPWIALTLATMVLSKLAVHLYADWRL